MDSKISTFSTISSPPLTIYFYNRVCQHSSSLELSTPSREQPKAKYPQAVFAKGRVHVHYCAWPMTPPNEIPAFATVEGHLYRWNALPFDYPFSSHMWQIHIENLLNKELVFARFFRTTFVVSACHPDHATSNLKTLLADTRDHRWSISVPEPQEWTSDVDSLDLGSLWRGIPPAAFKHYS